MHDRFNIDRAARWRQRVVALWVALALLGSPCFVICDDGGEHAAIEPVFAACCSPTLGAAGQAPTSAELAGAESDCPEECTDTLLAGDWAAVDKSKRNAMGSAQKLPPAPEGPGAGESGWAALRAEAPGAPSARADCPAVLRL